MSRIPCDFVCFSIIGVCILWLWGLVMCVVLDRCEANEMVGAFGYVLEHLYWYMGELLGKALLGDRSSM